MNTTLFRIKDFRVLFAGHIIAVLGDWFGIIAIITLAGFRWQVSPFQMSMVIFSLAAPLVVFGPLGGVIADRVERGRMMVVVSFARAILLVIITTAGNIVFLCFLLAILGTLDACFLPAKNGKLKEISPPELINDAVIYSSFVDQGARVLGPALGGFFLVLFSIEAALYVNAAGYFISAVILCFLSKIERHQIRAGDQKESFWLELKEGFKVMQSVPLIMYGALIQVFVIFTFQIVDSQFVIMLRDMPGTKDAWLGYCLMASGIGTVLVTFFYLGRHKELNAKTSMIVGVLLYSMSVIGISLWGMFGVFPAGFIPFFLLWGASGALIFVKYSAYVQTNIPADYSGRVFGSLGSLMGFASLTGLLAGGFLVSTFGASNSFLLVGVTMLIGGVWLKTRI